MQTLTAGDLALEPLCVSHAEAMFDLLCDQALYRYLDYEPPPSLEYLRDRYARLQSRRSPDGKEAWLNWAIRSADQALVGYVQATVATRHSYIAYVIGSPYWGRGYATKAVDAMLDHLASSYGVTECLATVEARNHRSIRLLERLGFGPADAKQLQSHNLSATERMFVRPMSKEFANAHDRIA